MANPEWCPVPMEGQREQEFVIEVKRQDGAIRITGDQSSWLEALCPE